MHGKLYHSECIDMYNGKSSVPYCVLYVHLLFHKENVTQP